MLPDQQHCVEQPGEQVLRIFEEIRWLDPIDPRTQRTYVPQIDLSVVYAQPDVVLDAAKGLNVNTVVVLQVHEDVLDVRRVQLHDQVIELVYTGGPHVDLVLGEEGG